jgi:UDP-glucose:(heptosyl)LPS alpha-1,3-glucosyltransferase
MRAAEGAAGTIHLLPRPLRPRGQMEGAFAASALRAARAEGCDVTVGVRHMEEVDVYWPHGGLHAATLAAGEASRGVVSGRISQTLHTFSPKHRAFVRMENELLGRRRAKSVWCVSDLVRREIAAAHPASAPLLELHANGVDLARFHPGLRKERRAAFLAQHGIDAGAPVLLFLGGNWRLKGWRVLLDALAELHGPWTLVAAGSGALARKKRDAERSGGRVVLLPRQDPRDLYAAADLLVQPTFRDPCSLATLEALACGVPVVTTLANGAGEAINSEIAGRVLEGDAPAPDLLLPVLRRWIPWLAVEAYRATEVAVDARRAAEARPEAAWLDGLVASLARAAKR